MQLEVEAISSNAITELTESIVIDRLDIPAPNVATKSNMKILVDAGQAIGLRWSASYGSVSLVIEVSR